MSDIIPKPRNVVDSTFFITQSVLTRIVNKEVKNES